MGFEGLLKEKNPEQTELAEKENFTDRENGTGFFAQQ